MFSRDQYHNPAFQERNYAEQLRQMRQKSSMAQKTQQAGIDILKKQVKKRVVWWIIGIIAANLPFILIGIGILFIIIITVVLIEQIPGI